MKTNLLVFLCATLMGLQAVSQNISDILEKSLGAVVTISVQKIAENETSVLLGYGSARGNESNADIAYAKALNLSGSLSMGSGFVIEKNGNKYVITNAHVIDNASDEPGSLFVYSINRKKYEMKLVGGDSFYDLAVLAFVTNPGNELVPVEFRKTDVRIGEQVFAIGNPGGKYPYSVSDGIISARNRVLTGIFGKFGFIQSTATVIWGNSGGPLLDASGKVVGINSQLGTVEDSEDEVVIQPQINFALESKISERIVDDILSNKGRVVRGYLGIEFSQRYITDNRAFMYTDIVKNTDSLPTISGVIPGSPAFSVLADKTGYQVVKINNVEVFDIEELLGEMEKIKPGQNVVFILKKGMERITITIIATELKESQLGAIAEYVIAKDDRITLQSGIKQLKVSIATNQSYKQYDYKNKDFNKMNTGSFSKQYHVISAGVLSTGGSISWKIETTADLGAVFRISGLAGVIDLKLIEVSNAYPEPETLRFSLSGEKYICKSTLWY